MSEIAKAEKPIHDGLTKAGFDGLFNRIVNSTVNPPTDLTAEMLKTWVEGYMRCQDDVLTIIGNLSDRYGR